MSNYQTLRETRGISQNDREAARGFYEKTLKEAEVRRWIFFSRLDRKIIDIHHSHGSWPSRFSIWDKMEMRKKDCVELKYQGKWLEFSLVQICHRDFVEQSRAKAEERLGAKLRDAQSESFVKDVTFNE